MNRFIIPALLSTLSLLIFARLIEFWVPTHSTGSSDESEMFLLRTKDPFLRTLHKGEIHSGTPLADVLAQFTPVSIKSYGQYTRLNFVDSGYDLQVMIAYNGLVLSANAGSCTWSKSFFDDLPADAREHIQRIRYFERVAAHNPAMTHEMQSRIQTELSLLK